MQCVAVWYNVLKFDALICSMLQCVAVCLNVLQCVAVSCSVCCSVCCSVLQWLAVCQVYITCYMTLSFIHCQTKSLDANKTGILAKQDVKGLFWSKTGSFWIATNFYLGALRDMNSICAVVLETNRTLQDGASQISCFVLQCVVVCCSACCSCCSCGSVLRLLLLLQ